MRSSSSESTWPRRVWSGGQRCGCPVAGLAEVRVSKRCGTAWWAQHRSAGIAGRSVAVRAVPAQPSRMTRVIRCRSTRSWAAQCCSTVGDLVYSVSQGDGLARPATGSAKPHIAGPALVHNGGGQPLAGRTVIMPVSSNWLGAQRAYLLTVATADLGWETAHLPLYTLWQTGTFGEKLFAVFHCTLGDLLIALAAITFGVVLAGHRDWPARRFAAVATITLLCGLGYTVFSEWLEHRRA